MAAISNSTRSTPDLPYRTGKRRLARILVGVELLLLGRMFVFPPAPEVITALSPYFAAFSALVTMVVITAYGLAAYANQILPAQNGKMQDV